MTAFADLEKRLRERQRFADINAQFGAPRSTINGEAADAIAALSKQLEETRLVAIKARQDAFNARLSPASDAENSGSETSRETKD